MYCPSSCRKYSFIHSSYFLNVCNLKKIMHVCVWVGWNMCLCFSIFYIYGHLHSLWSKPFWRFDSCHITLLHKFIEQSKPWWFLWNYVIIIPAHLRLYEHDNKDKIFWNCKTILLGSSIFYLILIFQCFGSWCIKYANWRSPVLLNLLIFHGISSFHYICAHPIDFTTFIFCHIQMVVWCMESYYVTTFSYRSSYLSNVCLNHCDFVRIFFAQLLVSLMKFLHLWFAYIQPNTMAAKTVIIVPFFFSFNVFIPNITACNLSVLMRTVAAFILK